MNVRIVIQDSTVQRQELIRQLVCVTPAIIVYQHQRHLVQLMELWEIFAHKEHTVSRVPHSLRSVKEVNITLSLVKRLSMIALIVHQENTVLVLNRPHIPVTVPLVITVMPDHQLSINGPLHQATLPQLIELLILYKSVTQVSTTTDGIKMHVSHVQKDSIAEVRE